MEESVGCRVGVPSGARVKTGAGMCTGTSRA